MNKAKSVVVVQERNNPSSDYFVLPCLKEQGLSFETIDHDVDPSSVDLAEKLIVFVRYVPKNWKQHVTKNKQEVAGVVVFLDDDLFDRSSFSHFPWRYKKKLLRLSYLQKNWFKKMNAQLWVSTQHLAQKYADWQPTLVLPKADIVSSNPIKVFYHGSSSHSAEIEWLHSVIETVLKRHASICFEIIGDHEVNKLFRGLPRVTVIHPMSWPNYQSFITQPGRHIGLAPLLDQSFNAARSYTKFFDICKAGAVGVYARHPSFAAAVEHDVNGLLVDMKQDEWVDAILSLASNKAGWMAMQKNALEACQRFSKG